MAAPSQSLASMSGCSQTPAGMAMAECHHPSRLCDFDFSSTLLSSGAFGSNDSLKNTLGVALSARFIVSGDLAPPARREWKDVTIAEPGKVSVRLFNSVLNL
jgi:hypothetical protein